MKSSHLLCRTPPEGRIPRPLGVDNVAESNRQRTTKEKLALFRACFRGLGHVYGTYDPRTGRSRQVKQPVTDQVLLRHLQGRQPYGVYLLVGDRTAAVVADFDREDTEPPLSFRRCARRIGIASYLERSKSKGWHVWIFLQGPGVSAAKARAVVRWMVSEVGSPAVEIFPKQDRLEGRSQFGNFVNAPLFGVLVPQGRTVFVNPDDRLRPWADQWSILESVERVWESKLDQIIDANRLVLGSSSSPASTPAVSTSPIAATYGLPPCAQRMLAEGVVDYQRVACFRLALHLKKSGLSEDLAVICLRAWARKNRPSTGKRIITTDEIDAQTRAAYRNDYRGCGCEEPAIQPYCVSTCPVYPARNAPTTTHIDPDPSGGGQKA